MAKRKASVDEERGTRMQPLHGGRHSLTPDMVAFNQRERLLAAVAAVVSEHGYTQATIAQISETASVSRRTFYEHFKSKDECFVAAYEALDDYLAKLMADAVAAEPEWADQVAATFAALIGFLATRPNFARLYLVEPAAVGEPMTARREKTAQRFIALLEAGREKRSGARELAEGIEEALVGGIVTLLARRILAGEADRLDHFAPAVIELALSPYLGPEEARRIAAAHPSQKT